MSSGFVWDRAQWRWVAEEDVTEPALTAGVEDHSDPWQFAGEEADAPVNPSPEELLDVDKTQPLPVINTLGYTPLTARPWRNCKASVALVEEINVRWPGRDKTSDGTIGDAAHAARTSDHNPWVVIVENGREMGIVRARDIDHDGIDAAWLAEYLRQLGAKGDARLAGGGYVIYNRRITNPDFKSWRTYTGSNPHTAHVHVSFSTNRAGYDSTASWGIAGGSAPTPTDPEAPELNSEERKLLNEIHQKLTMKLPSRVDYKLLGEKPPSPAIVDDAFGMALNADARSYEVRQLMLALLNALPTMTDPNKTAQAITTAMRPLIADAVREALGAVDSDKADAIVEAIGRRLIENK